MNDEHATSHAFPKSARVRRQSEFDRVFASRVYAADNVLVMNASRSNESLARLGLSVSRKVGNAVVRNRWKRLIREAFRQQRHRLPTNINIVVRPKKGAEPELNAIVNSLPQLALRCAKRLDAGR